MPGEAHTEHDQCQQGRSLHLSAFGFFRYGAHCGVSELAADFGEIGRHLRQASSSHALDDVVERLGLRPYVGNGRPVWIHSTIVARHEPAHFLEIILDQNRRVVLQGFGKRTFVASP